MNLAPKISVCLPVYNGQAYLRDSIRSILRQSFKEIELIIIDDGSTDGSVDISIEISKTDPRIRVYRHEKNMGLAKTMNDLVAYARAPYLAIQEQDDISLFDRLKNEYEYLEAHGDVGLVSGIAEWIDENEQRICLFPGILVNKKEYPASRYELINLLYVEGCKVVNAGCMFRKSIIDKVGSFDENARHAIDWQFFIRTAHYFKIVGIPEVFVKMRRGNQHQCLTKNKELMFKESRRCLTILLKEFKDNLNSPIDANLYRKAMARELNLEGRYYGGWKGLRLLIRGLSYNIFDPKLWSSFRELMLRGIANFLRLKFSVLV